MALSEDEKMELDGIVDGMAEEFEDIRAKNDGKPLGNVISGIEKALERDRYILRRLYERYPECGNRIPLHLAMHTGKVAGLNLISGMVSGGPQDVVNCVRVNMMAPMFSSIWTDMQRELVEEELENL